MCFVCTQVRDTEDGDNGNVKKDKDRIDEDQDWQNSLEKGLKEKWIVSVLGAVFGTTRQNWTEKRKESKQNTGTEDKRKEHSTIS